MTLPELSARLERLSQMDDDRIFKLVLAEAYRTGQLVPREVVEGLSSHFPTGLRQTRYVTATTLEPVDGSITCDCYCGQSFWGTDEQEVRHLWAEHAALASIKEAGDAGVV